MFYPKKSIHEILAATTEVSTAAEISYQIEDAWRKRLWILLAAIVAFFILLAVVTASISYVVLAKEKTRQEASLLTSVKAISKLATVQHHYMDVFEWNDQKDFILFQLKKSLLATGTASILAGVNLEESQVQVEKEGGRVFVTFPRAEIFSVDSELRFSGESDMIFRRISLEDRNRLMEESKETFRQKALEAGIISQAEERAASQITSYLEGLGYQAEIKFQ
ncbi:DUF4230 domain-containing protein [Ammoniphilus sp. CFH 90114]|uniref:DUF4230 domain-containing protein n=1 Tax=Ammoniphilus sp. CFH 90114 TaxID=2493665 RepID=UPI00100F83CB|nr:DUF4230 domain-containing protein [Ammoniphilus sp. CFH 90114]RXT08099.1 DUF4230 domain-containing protein [Ammoniphilus sp. CFH 90114]